jgi:hypothetical protein
VESSHVENCGPAAGRQEDAEAAQWPGAGRGREYCGAGGGEDSVGSGSYSDESDDVDFPLLSWSLRGAVKLKGVPQPHQGRQQKPQPLSGGWQDPVSFEPADVQERAVVAAEIQAMDQPGTRAPDDARPMKWVGVRIKSVSCLQYIRLCRPRAPSLFISPRLRSSGLSQA